MTAFFLGQLSQKNLIKDDFKYFSQGLDKNKVDLVKQKKFYPYGYMTDFEKFKEKLPSKESFIVPWQVKN